MSARPGLPCSGDPRRVRGLRDADGGEYLEHTLAGRWSSDPDERLILIGRTVERESETIRGEDERQLRAERVAGMIADVEADRERATHGTLELDPEE